MRLKDLQKHWDEFGKRDPLWAILTLPEKQNQKWNPAEFFQRGEEEIAGVMAYLDSLGLAPRRRKALDFGCGVGRLTQSLGNYFEESHGVDIAPSMIAAARNYNRHGDRCHYHLNDKDDLTLFADNSFDFIYSVIVLQHMQPQYSRKYIEEFLRILVPGGVLLFQIPSHLAPAPPALGQSATTTTLPDSAYKAQITLPEPLTTLNAGSRHILRVSVKNVSSVTWPALGNVVGHYQIQLGNHWLTAGQRLFVSDDGRAPLPQDLKPGTEVDVFLPVTAPLVKGYYHLELDMIQEAVTWFKAKGSKSTIVPLRVNGGYPRVYGQLLNLYQRIKRRLWLAGRALRFTPQMEMYGVPQAEVLALLQDHGGRVVDVQEDGWAGPGWLSFRYCVTKETE